MDTVQFFEKILPPTGVFYLVALSHKGPLHRAFTDKQEMAKFADMANQTEANVYHACGSYKEPFIIDSAGKRRYRTNNNWAEAKAFWVDLDCGEEKAAAGKGYLTKQDAMDSMDRFCTKVKLPLPMFVDSGNGVHAYWPLVTPITAQVWKQAAEAFKENLAFNGVMVDDACTSDFARILRPIGSHNKKHDPKLVTLIRDCELVQFEVFNAAFQYDCLPIPKQINTSAISINDDLIHNREYPQKTNYADEMALYCGQVAAMKDTEGDVSYDHWRGVIGLLKHCVDGEAKAHEWSAKRGEKHANTNVQEKLDTWEAGPTTCEFFSGRNPGICSICDKKGKITSPIQIACRIEPEAIADIEEHKIPTLPDNFVWHEGKLIYARKDADGQDNSVVLTDNLFYPIKRIRMEDGTYGILMRMHLARGGIREFQIPTQVLSNPARTLEELARYELIQANMKESGPMITAYLRDSLARLKQEAEETQTYTSYGWKNDNEAFLIGERLYTTDGTWKKVELAGSAKSYAHHFPTPRGTIEAYREAVERIYNFDNMRVFQYVICSAFGGILSPMGEYSFRGIMLALFTRDSGHGKTSSCAAGGFAFGDADEMALKKQTVNVIWDVMGTYNNLPVILEELTNIEPKEISNLVYSISNGESPRRMTTAGGRGVRAASYYKWRLPVLTNGNNNLQEVLIQHRANTEAEAVRILQINISEHKPTVYEDVTFVSNALGDMRENLGVAGEMVIKYVVQNYEEVQTKFNEIKKDISNLVKEPKYRFYRDHGACAMTACWLLNKLGILRFDYKLLFDWQIAVMQGLQVTISEQNSQPKDEIGHQVVNELWPNILFTSEYRDNRHISGPEIIQRAPQHIHGRYVAPSPPNKKGELEEGSGWLFLERPKLKMLCREKGYDFRALMDHFTECGVLIVDNSVRNIVRGTNLMPFNTRTVIVDYAKYMQQKGVEAPNLKIVPEVNPNSKKGKKAVS